MLDRGHFLEMLSDIKDIAEAQDNVLSQKEIQEFFGSEELSKEQLDLVYQYLEGEKIHVDGYDYQSASDTKAATKAKQESLSSACISTYFEELGRIAAMDSREEDQLYLAVRSGDAKAKERLIEGWLPRIADYAKRYKDKGALQEDLIQQGNIGLLMGVELLMEQREVSIFREFLEENILKAMEDYIDEMMVQDDGAKTVVAKRNLLYEATKYLCEDLGRTPTEQELAEYTHLKMEEITDILEISEKI